MLYQFELIDPKDARAKGSHEIAGCLFEDGKHAVELGKEPTALIKVLKYYGVKLAGAGTAAPPTAANAEVDSKVNSDAEAEKVEKSTKPAPAAATTAAK